MNQDENCDDAHDVQNQQDDDERFARILFFIG